MSNSHDFLDYVSPRLRKRVETRIKEKNDKKNKYRRAIEDHHEKKRDEFKEVWESL